MEGVGLLHTGNTDMYVWSMQLLYWIFPVVYSKVISQVLLPI